MKRILCILLLIGFAASLQAQDIHFSQIDINPILFNPAYSGFFDGSGRFGASYRNQWSTVSKAFQTLAISAELPLVRRRYWSDGLNIGAVIYSDRAGTLHYGISTANAVLSYYKAFGSSNNNFISVALEGGAGSAGYSTDNLVMEDMSENLQAPNSRFLTLSAGMAWFCQPNDLLFFKIGLSGHNLNRPNIAYLPSDNAFIERKISLYSRLEYRAWPTVAVAPLVAAMRQLEYTEMMFGCDVKWYLSETNAKQVVFSSGVHYRWRDAAMIELALEYNAYIFALTYDANFSKLTSASNTFGSFELGIVYRLNRTKRINRRALPCPIM